MKSRRQKDTFQFEENTFAKNALGIAKVLYEVLLIMQSLQTKPQVISMNINYFEFYYIVIKNLTEDDGEI